MSEEKEWWQSDELDTALEDMIEDRLPDGPIEGAVNEEPGFVEFAVLMIIVYVLWWADTGIL